MPGTVFHRPFARPTPHSAVRTLQGARALSAILGFGFFALVTVAVGPVGPARGVTPGSGLGPQDPWTLCPAAIPAQERAKGIPPQLLQAISLAESGRWQGDINRALAWPWTVMAEGQGRYFATKAEAVNEVMNLQKRGVRNIDVGCMQINLLYHPNAFASLNDAFDPSKNVAYAAKFLRELKDSHDSWTRAVGFYHSGTPEFHNRYREKVLEIWQTERERVTREARQRQQETLKARQKTAVSSVTVHAEDEMTASGASTQAARRSVPPMTAEEARRRQIAMQEIALLRREASLQRHEQMIEQQRAVADRYREALSRNLDRLDELRDRPWKKF